MALTTITTSGVDRLDALTSYSLEALDRMFLYGESPCQIGTFNSALAADMASNTPVAVMAAPGAGKSIYVWGVSIIPSNTAAVATYIVLQEGSAALVSGAFVVPFAYIPMAVLATPQPTHAPIHRIGHTVSANTAVGGISLGANAGVCKLRIYYAVL